MRKLQNAEKLAFNTSSLPATNGKFAMGLASSKHRASKYGKTWSIWRGQSG